ncbi:hypothetical protein GCM10010492_52240 [Saccharothrix mutabilis subsp. mutabilis]|uniref:Uncharacterized protein n=1 Tax=Saccharothrix mutabilis subsp. mutabilis TaxID=66855 RepID=A0ABP3E0Z9_9PSEU
MPAAGNPRSANVTERSFGVSANLRSAPRIGGMSVLPARLDLPRHAAAGLPPRVGPAAVAGDIPECADDFAHRTGRVAGCPRAAARWGASVGRCGSTGAAPARGRRIAPTPVGPTPTACGGVDRREGLVARTKQRNACTRATTTDAVLPSAAAGPRDAR